jgi:hypothetical protein
MSPKIIVATITAPTIATKPIIPFVSGIILFDFGELRD